MYGNEPFIRIVKYLKALQLPDPKITMGTNFCDVGFEIDETRKSPHNVLGT
jgi:N-acetyl-gamma-glutamyl-phosphate/LysW-gamma-L-alpha-aminoadipyl-6-phosphate reductase